MEREAPTLNCRVRIYLVFCFWVFAVAVQFGCERATEHHLAVTPKSDLETITQVNGKKMPVALPVPASCRVLSAELVAETPTKAFIVVLSTEVPRDALNFFDGVFWERSKATLTDESGSQRGRTSIRLDEIEVSKLSLPAARLVYTLRDVQEKCYVSIAITRNRVDSHDPTSPPSDPPSYSVRLLVEPSVGIKRKPAA